MERKNFEGLKNSVDDYLYSMRPFVRDRLITKFPNTWWKDGVENALDSSVIQAIERERKKPPVKKPIDYIEPSHIVKIVLKNWGIFQKYFPDYKTASTYLEKAVEGRSLLSHWWGSSDDIPWNDVYTALFHIEHILEWVGSSETAKKVLGVMEIKVCKRVYKKSQQFRMARFQYFGIFIRRP